MLVFLHYTSASVRERIHLCSSNLFRYKRTNQGYTHSSQKVDLVVYERKSPRHQCVHSTRNLHLDLQPDFHSDSYRDALYIIDILAMMLISGRIVSKNVFSANLV